MILCQRFAIESRALQIIFLLYTNAQRSPGVRTFWPIRGDYNYCFHPIVYNYFRDFPFIYTKVSYHSMHIPIVYYVIKVLNVFLTCTHIRKKFVANFLKLSVNNSIKKGDIIFEWAELLQEELNTLISHILVNNHIEE